MWTAPFLWAGFGDGVCLCVNARLIRVARVSDELAQMQDAKGIELKPQTKAYRAAFMPLRKQVHDLARGNEFLGKARALCCDGARVRKLTLTRMA